MASLDEGIESRPWASGQHAVCQPLPAPKDQAAGTSLDRGQGAGLGFERERVLFVPEKRRGQNLEPWGEPWREEPPGIAEAMALPCRGSLAGCPTQSWLGGGTGERGCCPQGREGTGLRPGGAGPAPPVSPGSSWVARRPGPCCWPAAWCPGRSSWPPCPCSLKAHATCSLTVETLRPVGQVSLWLGPPDHASHGAQVARARRSSVSRRKSCCSLGALIS